MPFLCSFRHDTTLQQHRLLSVTASVTRQQLMEQFRPHLGGVSVASKNPGDKPKAISIPRIRLIYGQNKEPTSGLEPLTCSSYE
jgi:hypothetical protein